MNTSTTPAEHFLDVKGLNCPLPILKIKKALGDISSGERLRIETTDSGSTTDVPAFAQQTGHTLISQDDRGDAFVFVIQKK